MVLFNLQLRDKGLDNFPKSINQKMTVIVWLEIELS